MGGQLAVRALLCAGAVAGLLVPAVASAAPTRTDTYAVRSLDGRDLGFSRPTSLAFSAADRALLVGEQLRSGTVVRKIGLAEERRGSLRLPALGPGSTLAFDPVRQRTRIIRGNGAVYDGATRSWLVLSRRSRQILRLPAAGGRGSSVSLRRLDGPLRAVALDGAARTIYVLTSRRVYALAFSGAIKRVIDLESLQLADARGLVVAPTGDPTDARGNQHLYIADRGKGAHRGRVVEVAETRARPYAFIAAVETVKPTLVQTIQTSTYSPPSPDPAGIAYIPGSDRLLISDSEVEEMSIYQGKNLFTATRTGSGTGTGTTTAYSPEPTGLAYKPSDGTLFISDDDKDRIFIDRPGSDGKHGTSDDTVTNFSTTAFGSGDAEGVEYDPSTGHVWICDGVGLEIYGVNPADGVFGNGNDVVTHFDIAQYGARDCEGLGLDAARNALLASDPSGRKIFELSKSGTLLRIFDLSGIPTSNKLFAGVVMAPTSSTADSASAMDYWLTDRHVDNGTDPNENDGLLYELSLGGAAPPPPNAAPTANVTAPAEGSLVAGSVTLRATASDDVSVASVRFAVGGTTIGTDSNGADGWSVPWSSTSVADGARTVTATATDGAGLTGSDSNNFTVDNTTPSVAVTSPAAGATVGGTVPVVASASDTNGVASVQFFADGASIGTDTNAGDGWSASWNTTGLANGAHSLSATATDRAGNTRASTAVQVNVNNNGAPAVTLTAPAEGALVADSVTVTANASDDNGVASVRFSVGGTTIATDTDGSNGWSASWDTTGTGDGLRTVTATATDSLGAAGSDSNNVTVDNTGPTVAISAPAPGASVADTVSVTAAAADANGVSSVQFLADGTPIGTDTNAADGWSASWNTTALANGSHTLTAIATDRAAHRTTSAPVQVTVANLSTVQVPLAAGEDDADQLSDGTVRLANLDLELGSDETGTATTTGLRFRALGIPAGTPITNAYVQFRSAEKSRKNAKLVVRAQRTDDALAFTTAAFDVSARLTTTAFASWQIAGWQAGATGTEQRTPNLSAVLQEIVDRPGWSPTSALAVLITGAGRRTATSYEGGTPPVLVVQYVAP